MSDTAAIVKTNGAATARMGRITVTATLERTRGSIDKVETAWATASAMFGIIGLNELDALVRTHSASTGLVDLLCGTYPTYRPTLRVADSKTRRAAEKLACAERARIADAYDYLAEAMGDERRAHRAAY